MNNIYILGREIPLYGVFFYIGIALASVAGVFVCSKKKFPKIELLYSGIYTFIGAILGAKLLFLLVSLRQIIEYNIPIINVIKGGFVFYGGFLGGLLGLFIYVKQFKEDFLKYADIYAAVVPLGHAAGRVGCFFAGCCYGMPVEWGHVYEQTAGNTPLGVPLLPIQLIESAGLLLLFAVQIILVFRYPERKKINTYFYMLSYPILRFTLEFFRGDAERGRVFFSTSQWISLAIFVIACIFTVKEILDVKKQKIT